MEVTPAHYKPTVEVDVADLEALVQSSALVRDILTAASVHRNDVMVQRTAGHVMNAIANCQRKIDASRRVPDPRENDPPTESELRQMDHIRGAYKKGAPADDMMITPREGESLRIKRLAVLGTREVVWRWGNKIQEVKQDDRLYWRLTDKGEQFYTLEKRPHA